MPSRPELTTWACNTNLRSVKIWHSLDAPRTPWDRHAAPVTALKIRSPSAVANGLPSCLIGVSVASCKAYRAYASAATLLKTCGLLFRTSRVSPLPHANDSAPAVIHQLSPAIKLGSPLHDGLANAICIAAGKVRAPSPHICVLQHLRIAAMPPLEH